jgi:hypothetical protein
MSRTPLTAEQVLALSPDDASTKSARGLVAPAKWPMLGANDGAVWGECQGSGSKPYQTKVDVSAGGPVFRCSCPSRKFPCKHGLALLLLQAQSASDFVAPEPAWVSEWLASRKDRAEKKEIKAQAAPAVVDPALSAKREAQRHQRMAAGAQELALWLDDLCRKGLASLTQTMALVGQGRDWPARLPARLGKLQLLLDAVAHPERLTPPLQADLRQALGWPMERDEVLAHGEQVADQWAVIAQVMLEREARLSERRVWLQGANSQRRALLLDFSFAGKAFEQGWVTGTTQSCSLAFYPGADSQRALLVGSAEAGVASTMAVPLPGGNSAEWTALATRIAANPWANSWPLCLTQVVLQAPDEGESVWWLWTEQGSVPLQIAADDAWLLMAFAGGAPLTLFGEWTGETLLPLTAWNASGHWAASSMAGGRA